MNGTTGIVLSWENDAMSGAEMPAGLSYPDQILYQQLRLLYWQYRQNVVDRETAKREKLKFIEEYKRNQFRERLGKYWVEITKSTEIARAEYRKNPCHENAMKLVEILEGRK